MFIVHVNVHVKAEHLQAFLEATIENARQSVLEPGIARFDVLQHKDDPTRFVLLEVYHTSEDPGLHKQTPHYARWNENVAAMMAEPRTRTVYANIYPNEAGWG